LAAALFALAGPSVVEAAPVIGNVIVIEVDETGAGAPNATYVVTVTGSDFSTSVQVVAGQSASVSEIPAGTYEISQANSPPGATIQPNAVTLGAADTATVTVTNPYPAGRFSLFRPPNEGVANCAVTIRNPSGVAVAFVPLERGATVTTDWLPLGSYLLTWPAIKPSFVTQRPTLDVDGVTVAVNSCWTAFPRPHPYGRIAIDVVEVGAPGGGPYTFVISWADPPVYDGPANEPIEATVSAGQTWISSPVPAGRYSITASEVSLPVEVSPNPVTVPEACWDPVRGVDNWCTGDDPPTHVTVTVHSPNPPSVAESATPTPVTDQPAPTLVSTGVRPTDLLIPAALLTIAGEFLRRMGRRPEWNRRRGEMSRRHVVS
jgi:hypothetical protein